ncbi:MAG: MerR family transcriptional regulator [Caloramator sp.]|nr:MerR family transcriptional regulator [Caloramator sp.]
MGKYFSIGEISKLSNLSVQTLRHYDKLDLLKPSLVKNNGYRYYSLDQLYLLDLIRFYRKLGLSLSEIKRIIADKIDIEDTIELFQNQQYEIEKQIKELEKQKDLIKKKHKYIKSMLKKPQGTAFLNKKNKIRIAKIKTASKDLESAEIRFRKALKSFTKLNDILSLELLYEIKYEPSVNNKKEEKHSICFIITDDYIEEDNIKICELNEGLYASIIYIDYYDNYKKDVDELFKFIDKKNLHPEGSLYERYIASEFSDKGEKGFMELFIKVCKNP